MSLTVDLSEEISPFSVTWRNNKLLDTYQQKPCSSELKSQSDLESLQKLLPVRNNVTEFTECPTNYESFPPDLNSDEWFCLSEKQDDGGGGSGGADATGENHRSGLDSQVRVSSNPKSPLPEIVSRLHDTIQEPKASPMKNEEVAVKPTHSDTEFGSDVAGNENVDDELGESLCIKKRKREIHDELKGHFEELVNKMMNKQEDMYKVFLEKQEDMYRVLLEKIEQKEKDRITREQTWKNLEMERMRKESEQMEKDRIRREETWRNLERELMRKEEEKRAHDTHRSLALVSHLEQRVISTPGSTGQQIISIPHSSKIDLDDQSGQKKQKITKWPKHEVQALISLRMAVEPKYLIGASKFQMWEEISLGMVSMGFTRTAKKCREKWENIYGYFRRVAGSSKQPGENAKTYPYFQELDMFYQKCLLQKAQEAAIEKAPEAEIGTSSNELSTSEHQSIFF
ncbi:hypothetical protein C5167_039818 [Papaver somniferum]|uniref:Myb-like domain-containing protein n=1 Tax=Papaver somniferum TaxID=3469 RepID=A0A4Y7IDC6_PAPSO|nr:trihelix transcription factor GT-2-like [Papaver somniferum]RZC46854.1 hypothetical protein C5167_039818 [Papaver somniferum]